MAHFDLENQLWLAGHQLIAGVDEAGRGCLAGPVVVAAVVVDQSTKLEGVADSKTLTPDQRETLFDMICKRTVRYHVTAVGHQEVDKLNILQATMQGMRQVLEAVKPDYALVDGNRYPECKVTGHAVIKGDSLSKSIAAASILAKVSRDRIMCEFAMKHPQWNFSKHKGYPTSEHRQLIEKFGLSPIHRRSFKVKSFKQPLTSL